MLQFSLWSYVEGILPKGPYYPPCLRMADWALLAGYPRCMQWISVCTLQQHSWLVVHHFITVTMINGGKKERKFQLHLNFNANSVDEISLGHESWLEQMWMLRDDVIKWKHFPHNWPFVRGIHRSPVNSPHKGQWRGALMFSLICVWINSWVNNREVGDLRRYRTHYDITVMNICVICLTATFDPGNIHFPYARYQICIPLLVK